MRKTSHGQNSEPLLEHFLSRLRFAEAIKYITPNSKVADVGCGYNGTFLKNIANKVNQGIGFDIVVNNNKLPKNIQLKRVDINRTITSKKIYFDTAVALAVLEHVNNPNKFLSQISKMLKRKGVLVITTPHKRSKIVLELLSVVGLVSKHEIDDHKNYFNEKILDNILKENKFKIVELKTFEFGLNLFCAAEKK